MVGRASRSRRQDRRAHLQWTEQEDRPQLGLPEQAASNVVLSDEGAILPNGGARSCYSVQDSTATTTDFQASSDSPTDVVRAMASRRIAGEAMASLAFSAGVAEAGLDEQTRRTPSKQVWTGEERMMRLSSLKIQNTFFKVVDVEAPNEDCLCAAFERPRRASDVGLRGCEDRTLLLPDHFDLADGETDEEMAEECAETPSQDLRPRCSSEYFFLAEGDEDDNDVSIECECHSWEAELASRRSRSDGSSTADGSRPGSRPGVDLEDGSMSFWEDDDVESWCADSPAALEASPLVVEALARSAGNGEVCRGLVDGYQPLCVGKEYDGEEVLEMEQNFGMRVLTQRTFLTVYVQESELGVLGVARERWATSPF